MYLGNLEELMRRKGSGIHIESLDHKKRKEKPIDTPLLNTNEMHLDSLPHKRRSGSLTDISARKLNVSRIGSVRHNESAIDISGHNGEGLLFLHEILTRSPLRLILLGLCGFIVRKPMDVNLEWQWLLSMIVLPKFNFSNLCLCSTSIINPHN